MTPLITVLMPVYNTAPYLREAVDSILRQTFTDFILLAIDDGSTDGSLQILQSYSDPRLQIVRNPHNLGLVATLNRGLDMARSPFIARMDSDDISLPQRFALQVDFMRRQPEVGIVGSIYIPIINQKMKTTCTILPQTPEDIRAACLFNYTMSHPSVMMRTTLLQQHNLRYRAEYPHAEDFDLWERAVRCFPMANLPEILLLYRRHDGQVSTRFTAIQANSAMRVRANACRRYGYDPEPEDIARFSQLAERFWRNDPAFVRDAVKFLQAFHARLQIEDPLEAAAIKQRFARLRQELWQFVHTPRQRALRFLRKIFPR